MIRRWDMSKPPRGAFTLNRDCVAAQGLVLWYPLGVHGPKLVYDYAGIRHPTTVNNVTALLGRTGEPALAFANGSLSKLQLTDNVPVSTPPLSIGMWFAKTTASDTTGYGLANISADSSSARFQFDTYNGDLRWIAVNSGGSAGSASKSGIVSGRWHHGLGVEVSTSSRFACLDGVAGTEGSTSITVDSATKYWAVGALAAGGAPEFNNFSGNIGEVCVWDRSVYALRTSLADPGRRFELWYPLRSQKWFTQTAGAVTGTANITPAAQTLTASGSVAVSGTASITPAAQTLTASGTVVSGVEGTASITPAAQTVTANGTIQVAATATITPAEQTTTATGAVAVAATATITPAAQTLSANGVVVSGVVGTASITPTAQTATANGTVAILATAAVSPAAQTLSATGVVSGGAATGTANIFVSAQTLVAQANIIVLGVATITPAPQTLTAYEAGVLPADVPDSSRTLAAQVSRLGATPLRKTLQRFG